VNKNVRGASGLLGVILFALFLFFLFSFLSSSVSSAHECAGCGCCNVQCWKECTTAGHEAPAPLCIPDCPVNCGEPDLCGGSCAYDAGSATCGEDRCGNNLGVCPILGCVPDCSLNCGEPDLCGGSCAYDGGSATCGYDRCGKWIGACETSPTTVAIDNPGTVVVAPKAGDQSQIRTVPIEQVAAESPSASDLLLWQIEELGGTSIELISTDTGILWNAYVPELPGNTLDEIEHFERYLVTYHTDSGECMNGCFVSLTGLVNRPNRPLPSCDALACSNSGGFCRDGVCNYPIDIPDIPGNPDPCAGIDLDTSSSCCVQKGFKWVKSGERGLDEFTDTQFQDRAGERQALETVRLPPLGTLFCLGDDAGEVFYELHRECVEGVCKTDVSDKAVCDKPTDCVYEGVCYSDIHTVADSKFDGSVKEVKASTWRTEVSNSFKSRWESPSAPWSGRSGSVSLVFKNKLWLLGGRDTVRDVSDVWYTANGRDWTLALQFAPWSAKSGHAGVVFKDKLWILGGSNPGIMRPDVWSSDDGITWIQAPDVPWSARTGHAAVVFQDKIWVIGGKYNNDVWSSPDGNAWTKVLDPGPWNNGKGLPGISVVVFDNKMWILNAPSGNWYSSDGVSWIKASDLPSEEWSQNFHRTVIFNGKMWVVAKDVWSTSDGVSWNLEKADALPYRLGDAVVAFDGRIWAMGGWARNDVWSSPNGVDWTQELSNAAFAPTTGQTAATFDGKMWVMGGYTARGYSGEIWYSSNGADWERVPPSPFTDQWTPRTDHTSLVFDDKLWVLGGVGGCGNSCGIVAYSSDGHSWTISSQSNQYSTPFNSPSIVERYGHSSAVFNGEMWVLGGTVEQPYGGLRRTSDVYHSADGKRWTYESAPWSPRRYHSSVVFDDKLWVFGGFMDSAESDVWYTSDGKHWERAPNAPWPARFNTIAVTYDGKLWVMGGFVYDEGKSSSDMWFTEDGMSWELYSLAEWLPRSGSSAIVFNETLWLLGGSSEEKLLKAGFAGKLEVPAVCDPGTWMPEELPASITGFVRNISVENEKGSCPAQGCPVEGAEVRILGTGLTSISAADGSYLVENVPEGTYDIAVSKQNDGYEESVVLGVLLSRSVEQDFILVKPLGNCNDDCTTSDGLCSTSCGGKGLCRFFSEQTEQICERAAPGIVYLGNGQQISCCTGGPYTPVKADVQICADNVVAKRIPVLRQGQMVNLVLTVFNADSTCEIP
jgi:hypothetical protein